MRELEVERGGALVHHRRRELCGLDEGITRSSRLRMNLELMRRQLHALRDAFAVAFLLNRTGLLRSRVAASDVSHDRTFRCGRFPVAPKTEEARRRSS